MYDGRAPRAPRSAEARNTCASMVGVDDALHVTQIDDVDLDGKRYKCDNINNDVADNTFRPKYRPVDLRATQGGDASHSGKSHVGAGRHGRIFRPECCRVRYAVRYADAAKVRRRRERRATLPYGTDHTNTLPHYATPFYDTSTTTSVKRYR